MDGSTPPVTVKTPAAHYDIVIVGGGLGGASLACALAPIGFRVAVLEHKAVTETTLANYDDRSSALSWGTRLLLDKLGVWSGIQDQVAAIEHIHISERGYLGMARIHAREEGVEALGYVCENRVLGRALMNRVATFENIDYLAPAALVQFEEQENETQLDILLHEQPHQLTTQLLIACDGSFSQVRELSGRAVQVDDYEQSGIIANVTTSEGVDGTAYERFTPTGPLAMLPLTEGRHSMVMSVAREEVDDLMALDDAAFAAQLQKRFGHRLGRIEKVGRRDCFPFRLMQMPQPFAGRLLFIGNALRSLHPVSGQGYNLLLRDVMALADALTAETAKIDPANPEIMATFLAQREADQRSVVRFTDSLVRIFQGRFSPVAHLRSAGLILVDIMPPIRRLLARQSMGLRVPLPRLRGIL